MKENGWKIDVSNSNDSSYAAQCGCATWFGYKYGYPTGAISTTLMGSGRAVLDFGNCYDHGDVRVSLNNEVIGSAGPNILSKQISFDYSRNSFLMIIEENMAIIKLNSLTLGCSN